MTKQKLNESLTKIRQRIYNFNANRYSFVPKYLNELPGKIYATLIPFEQGKKRTPSCDFSDTIGGEPRKMCERQFWIALFANIASTERSFISSRYSFPPEESDPEATNFLSIIDLYTEDVRSGRSISHKYHAKYSFFRERKRK